MATIKMNMKKRMKYILVFCVFIFCVLTIKTAYLQIVQGDKLQKEAIIQQTRDRIINSKRGSILDRNGKPLAVSASVETVSASPNEIRSNKDKISVEDVAKRISEILALDYNETLAKISKNSPYEILKRKIEKDEADKVRAFIEEKKVKGIRLDSDTKRFYPYGNFASNLIGFTGLDNQGLDGVEMMYDKYLKGSPGRVVSAKNAAGIDMPFKYEKMVDPQDGLNVVLTIDESIQRFAEKHLETAMIENKLSNGAACIVMDVKSGEILAMVTKPDYDLNQPFTLQNAELKAQIDALPSVERAKKKEAELAKMWRNKAVVDTYEPGSTFKIFTAAMAIEENLLSVNDSFYCNGSKKVATHNIRCWKAGGHGKQTFVEAMQNSCNVAFMEIGERIGNQKFFDYYKGFGFKEKTGIKLPGEAIGPFHPFSAFNEVELATSSFGQSFQITPLQMISAVGAVANDGKFMRPKIVRQITDKENNIVEEYQDEYIRQVISAETTKVLRDALESVVSEGSGSGAYIKGYRVAGKTGTSEKLPRGNGKYVASFVGFAPADNPSVVCLVLLDEPNAGVYFGGLIAAPVARNILDDTLNYLGTEPAYTPEERATLETTVPNMINSQIAAAQKMAKASNLKFSVIGKGEKVLNQIPKAGVKVNQQSTIMLYTEDTKASTMTIVPDVLNRSVIEASNIISQAKLNVNIVGAGSSANSGGVVSFKQEPTAGTQAEVGRVVTVEFRRIEIGE